MKELKAKLETMRKEAKLSRHKLADISGFNEHTIKAYETTDTPPSAEYIKFCSIYFGYKLFSLKTPGELVKMCQAEQVLRIFGAIYKYSNLQLLSFINKEGFTAKTAQEAKNDDISDELLGIVFTDKSEEDFNEAIEYYHIQKDDYTPSKYADFIKSSNFLKAKGSYSDLDIEILILLNNKSDDFKKALIALLKAQDNQNERG